MVLLILMMSDRDEVSFFMVLLKSLQGTGISSDPFYLSYDLCWFWRLRLKNWHSFPPNQCMIPIELFSLLFSYVYWACVHYNIEGLHRILSQVMSCLLGFL